MEEIIKTIRYVLFKKIDDFSEYSFIRIKEDGIENIYWSLGYKNKFGGVSLIGNPIIGTVFKELENEYQIQIEKERREIFPYYMEI